MMTPYIYTSQDSASSFAIAEWAFEPYQSCKTLVLPDGCCDIIVKECTDKGRTWFVSDLSQSAYVVSTALGTKIQGVRLHPGVGIRENDLHSWLQGKDLADLFKSDQLNEFCTGSDSLSTALECLASGKRTVLCVAKELGISLRTLERHVKSGTGKPPGFWFSLARARKAGRSLGKADSLSDAAIDAGFADQPHMNREMKKWFGRTPAQIRMDNEVLGLLTEPGYG